MSDQSYTLEVKLASKNGYHTPAEAKAYYGRYSREGLTCHWWGDGTGASNHDNIVNFMNGRASRGEASVNYVLSDNKITLCVNPDNVAWCSQSGNPVTVSVETQPTLGNEGYKKWGWLLDQLEGRYGRSLQLFPHKYWFATACPGTIDLGRIRAEADKWKRGDYDAQPAPAPAPVPVPVPKPLPTVNLEIKDVNNKNVILTKDANLWNLQFAKYPDAQSLKSLPMGTVFEVSAVVTHPLGSKYYISEYSYAKGIPNGINAKDTDYPDPDKLNDPIMPPPIEVPVPVTPKPSPEPPVVVDPGKGTKDDEQDRRLSAIEAFIEAIKKFFKGA